MAFQTLSKEAAQEFMGAKRQSSPRGEVTKYIDYVKEIKEQDIAGMIDIRAEMPEGATQKEISSRANVEVSRVKSAAKAAGVDLIVVKRGDKVIFRPIDDGEEPNAGPNAPERQARGPRGQTLAEFQAQGNGDDDEDEDDEDEDDDESGEENVAETAITGGSRRRAAAR